MRRHAVLARLTGLFRAAKPSRGDLGAVVATVGVYGLAGPFWAAVVAGGLLLASEALSG